MTKMQMMQMNKGDYVVVEETGEVFTFEGVKHVGGGKRVAWCKSCSGKYESFTAREIRAVTKH